jgi:abscisic-aldehyde oxidase
MASSSITFAVNGEVVTVANPDPSVTLNDYIRTQTPFTGTKLACGEGGCGACAVMLSRVDPATGQETHVTAHSCLRPLVACDGLAVTTTEGLGGAKKGLHPVQKRIADFNGSQCGFCTPGMVMATYAALLRAADETKTSGGAAAADPKSLALLMEEGIDGNICRCTGYRPILEAARSLVDDAIVDQVGAGCKTDAREAAETGSVVAASSPPPIPAALLGDSSAAAAASAKAFRGPTLQWHRPTTVAAAVALHAEHGAHARFVVANTSVGIYKNEPQSVLIDLGAVAELRAVSAADAAAGAGVTVGAAVPIAQLISTLRARSAAHAASFTPQQRASADALARQLDRVASHHVRNVGSVGGNLALVAKHGFASDLATSLAGYGATVDVARIADGAAATHTLLAYVGGGRQAWGVGGQGCSACVRICAAGNVGCVCVGVVVVVLWVCV